MGLDQRTRDHLKAIVDEIAPMATASSNSGVQFFTSGVLAGIGMAARIADGSTAEAAMEELATGMQAAIGRAYLDGTLSAPGPQPV